MEFLVSIGILVGIYLFPALVASARSKRQANAIFVLNLLTGWTALGWIVAMVWAVMED